MNDGENDTPNTQDMLTPRTNLPWQDAVATIDHWGRPFLIDNLVTRDHSKSMSAFEKEERAALRDVVESELAHLRSELRRFWISEYRFVETFLTFRQLSIYAPSFWHLARIMPKTLVFCRRRVVQKYLEQHNLKQTSFVSKLCRQFVRSSVLFYPAEKLIAASEKFVQLAINSTDQSWNANRYRVAMQIRTLHLLSDPEICNQFRNEENYLNEVALLNELARHYGLSIDSIFRISAVEVYRFWNSQH
jgi:hypothetical protein